MIMSKLEKLIQKLCPNGVEFKKVKDVFKRIKGTSITAKKMKEINTPDGKIKVFAGGKTVINAREEDIPNANITRMPAVLVQSRGIIDVVYYEKPFTFKNEMWAYTTDNKITVKFLYYVLKNNIQKFRNLASGMGSLPQISLPVTEEFVIPVPPLPIQSEIVRILDNFTELIAGLTAELAAELTARQRQYNYYRNKLLTFDNEVNIVSLRDVVKRSCSGATPAKGTSDFYENGTIPWIRTQDVKFNEIYEVDSFITEKAVRETAVKWIPENCVIVTISGASAGRCAVNKIKVTTNQHCLNMEIDPSKALYKYVYYCMCRKYSELLLKRRGARGDLNSTLILDTKLALPDLQVQQRIVNVLDNFDVICSELNIGLPAEIEARQRQYEYYRDILLTFSETGAIVSDEQRATSNEQRATSNEQRAGMIKLIQYVFGFVMLPLDEICYSVSSGKAKTKNIDGKYPVYGSTGIIARTNQAVYNKYFGCSCWSKCRIYPFIT